MEPGRRIGDYEVIDEIGRGGMGRVYRVRNVIANRLEAVKVLLPEPSGSIELAERFLREIRVVASLDHPNIAALRTAMAHGEHVMMVMELVDGEPLSKRLRRGSVAVADAIGWYDAVLAALAYAHERQVIHRDVKPANIMITRDGSVKLLDFGLARSAVDRSLTTSGTTAGSVPYMSPEQIRAGVVDARSDLYSVGVSLYETVTGSTPFQGANEFATMSAHLEQQPAPPRALRPDLPVALDRIILRAIAKRPEDRFQSATEFRAALQAVERVPQEELIATTQPVMRGARPDARGERQTGAVHPLAYIALGAVLVAVAAAGTGAYLRGAEARANQELRGDVSLTGDDGAGDGDLQSSSGPPPEGEAAARPVPSDGQQAPDAGGPVRPSSQASQDTRPAPAQLPLAMDSVPAAAQSPGPPVQVPDVVPDIAAELDQATEELDRLSARAAAVNDSLEMLRQQQAPQGVTLRGDMAGRQQSMNLRAARAEEALRLGNLALARRHTAGMQSDLETLERFLGR